VTPSEFKAIFPQFTAETTERVQAFLDLAVPYFNVERWGDFYSEGLANFVAHSIVVGNYEAAQSTSIANANDVSSKTVGALSVSRDGTLLNWQAKDPFMRTTYGQRYAYLRRKIGLGGFAV
jgi:hypothetical protein